MKNAYLVFVFCFTGLLFAQDHLSSRNGIGWDNGISYRRYLRDDLWLGVTMSGNLNKLKRNDTTLSSTHYIANDSTDSHYSYNFDTMTYYSGTIKFELGKRIVHYNIVELNTNIFVSYSYRNSKGYRGGTNPYTNSNPQHTVSGGIGFEPMIWITKALSIGTDFGIQFDYTFAKNNSNDLYYNNSRDINKYSSSGTYSSRQIKSFGDFSLSTGLIGFVWF
jgi:hypothetical protein